MAAPRRNDRERSDRERSDRERPERDVPSADREREAARRERGGVERAQPPAARGARPPPLNDYWIDGDGINREVLQTEICKYLGPEATSRPGDYNGRRGFRIKALRPFTPQMLEDLKSASRDYMSENRESRARYDEDLPYTHSQTYRGRDPEPNDPGFSPPNHSYGQVDSYTPQQQAYSQVSGYSSGPGYLASADAMMDTGANVEYLPTPGGMRQNPNYTYEQPAAGDFAPQGHMYAQGPGGYDVRDQRASGPMPGYVYRSAAPEMSGRAAAAMDPNNYGYYDPAIGMPGNAAAGRGAYPPPPRNQVNPYETRPEMMPPRDAYPPRQDAQFRDNREGRGEIRDLRDNRDAYRRR